MKRAILLISSVFLALIVKSQDIEIISVSFSDSPIGFLGMAQDKYGYIWMSDNGNGLYKYDGNNTIVYKPEPGNPNSPASGRIENVIIDKEGIIWLIHFDSGMDRFDAETETFTHFIHDDQDSTSICSDAARDIVEDLEGNLWIGAHLGLDKFDKKTETFIHDFSDDPEAEILRKEHVRKLYVDKSGIIWIGTGSVFFGEETAGGLFRLNPRTGEIDLFRHTEEENSLIDNRVRAIFEDSRRVFWVGTAGDGLHTMNREEGTFTRHTYDADNPEKLSRPPTQNIFNFGVDHISFINEDEAGFIWIGTFGNGLNRYNPVTETISHYGPDETGKFKIDIPSYWGFLKTHEGLLWLASFGTNNSKKLTKIDLAPNKFKFYDFEQSIRSAAEGKEGLLYFGTTNGIMNIINKEPQYLFKTYDEQGKNNHWVREIAFDKNENIWAGTRGAGLFFFNRKTKELINYRHEQENTNSLSNDYVGTILVQENGEILIGTSNGLDILNTEKNKFEHFKLANSTFSDVSFQRRKLVSVDNENRIWVAGEGGVFLFDRKTGKFKKYDLGIGNEIILNLFKDINGDIWIGTINHGLRRYNNESDSFQPVLDETGYLNKYSLVGYIGQGINKAIWFGLDGMGLVKYELQSKQATFFGKEWMPGFIPYSLQAILTRSNGDILVGTRNGYYKFHPDDFKRPESAIPKPFVEKLLINNQILSTSFEEILYKSFRENSSINLSSDQKDISIQLSYLDYHNNQGSQSILYKLEGFDKDWRKVLSGDMITYYQLPPNQYDLQIKAQDIYGNLGEKNLSIYIAAPWYMRWWAYIVYAMVIIAGIIVVDRFQRKRLLKKALEKTRAIELEQAKKIRKAYDALEIAHSELKSTQSQLIQSEKMASLGELTAGIAHEIQNPLNFVNNFSEVNKELIEELEAERSKEKGERDDTLEKEILKDLKENEEKIKHHGQRAEGIVKGMLQHSRTSKGEKEPTDINALADEYLRLAYHGLRAKDKSFNADFKTDLDPTLPKINVIPQDIGRVLLNLINNAFHAVAESSKLEARSNDYKPEVIVSSKKLDDKVEIRVKDNGPGIPEKVRDKIFQPFFTTKSTGEGTGLGLSLSYDIITKGHGGTIEVNSLEGHGSEFLIVLLA